MEEADPDADLLEQMLLPSYPESEKERLASWLRLPRGTRVAIRRLHRNISMSGVVTTQGQDLTQSVTTSTLHV